jgi:hypothetical protein
MSKSGRQPADLDAGTRARLALTRRLIVSTGWKVVVVGIVDFFTLRIWAPDLVNLHQDLALAGGLGCVAIALLATLWLALQLWIDVRRFAIARHALGRTHVYRIED